MYKKYYFLVRRSPDIDHSAPIIHALLKKGIPCSNITLTDLSLNHSNLNFDENKLFQYIKKKKINTNFLITNIYISFLKKIYFNEEHINFEEFGSIKKSIFKRVMRISLLKVIELLFIFKAIFYSIKRNKIFIIFKDKNFPFKIIYYLSKKNHILNLPHGFPPWDGAKDEIYGETVHQINSNHPLINSTFFSGQNNFEWFYFFNIKISKLSNKIQNKKKIFPLRYTHEWTNLLKKEIFKKNGNFIRKSEIVVTYFAQKDPSSKDEFSNFILEKAMLLHILKNYKEIQLNIRLHPSQLITKKNSFIKEISNHKNCRIYAGEKTSSFELINNSDIIMGTYTTALLDAVSLNKEIIILKHLTKINCSLEINKTQNHENFKEIFDTIFKSLNENKKINHAQVYNRLIIPEDYKGQDIFNFYLTKIF